MWKWGVSCHQCFSLQSEASENHTFIPLSLYSISLSPSFFSFLSLLNTSCSFFHSLSLYVSFPFFSYFFYLSFISLHAFIFFCLISTFSTRLYICLLLGYSITLFLSPSSHTTNVHTFFLPTALVCFFFLWTSAHITLFILSPFLILSFLLFFKPSRALAMCPSLCLLCLFSHHLFFSLFPKSLSLFLLSTNHLSLHPFSYRLLFFLLHTHCYILLSYIYIIMSLPLPLHRFYLIPLLIFRHSRSILFIHSYTSSLFHPHHSVF